MRQKHLIYALIFLCLLGSSIARIVYSQQNVAALRTDMENKKDALKAWKESHKVANGRLNEMIRSVKSKYKSLKRSL